MHQECISLSALALLAKVVKGLGSLSLVAPCAPFVIMDVATRSCTHNSCKVALKLNDTSLLLHRIAKTPPAPIRDHQLYDRQPASASDLPASQALLRHDS